MYVHLSKSSHDGLKTVQERAKLFPRLQFHNLIGLAPTTYERNELLAEVQFADTDIELPSVLKSAFEAGTEQLLSDAFEEETAKFARNVQTLVMRPAGMPTDLFNYDEMNKQFKSASRSSSPDVEEKSTQQARLEIYKFQRRIYSPVPPLPSLHSLPKTVAAPKHIIEKNMKPEALCLTTIGNRIMELGRKRIVNDEKRERNKKRKEQLESAWDDRMLVWLNRPNKAFQTVLPDLSPGPRKSGRDTICS
eukprot:GEMP01059288.1.p1 GENE.GEMP01059288.1~~GEMP01059288.1.p1  ORF type:complete len:262 (+),score=46.16 GEMP01059288.1:40-786(+)